MATNHLLEIEQHGQSIWMDNLSRDIIQSGELEKAIEERGLLGITSNPAIFQKAIAGNKIYDTDIEAGIKAGKSVMEIYESLAFTDIGNTCDIFRSVYDKTNGIDGYVSLEVEPKLARDAEGTIREARRYFKTLARPNLMIKIPGTPEGLVAVEQAIAEGINVNVTLLFSVQSYVDTAWAYIGGLEKFAESGGDVSKVASVASFFISRIDAKIDALFDKLAAATDDADKKQKLEAAKGSVAIANAKMAYQEYEKIMASDRWKALVAKGAQEQRLLWASTSTKNPDYSDVLYVDQLIGPHTVNTLPPKTIEACYDHCEVPGDTILSDVEIAQALIAGLPELGVDLDAVMAELLDEGITKFIQPFDALIQSLEEKMKQLVPA